MIRKYIVDIMAVKDISEAIYKLKLNWTKIDWVKVEKTEDDIQAILTVNKYD